MEEKMNKQKQTKCQNDLNLVNDLRQSLYCGIEKILQKKIYKKTAELQLKLCRKTMES